MTDAPPTNNIILTYSPIAVTLSTMSQPPAPQPTPPDPVEPSDEPQLDPALLAAAAPRSHSHHNISHDCPCTTCGYNLRGLPYNSHCPECNADTAASLRGRWLYYMTPAWVTRLGLGATLLGLSVTAAPVAIALLWPVSYNFTGYGFYLPAVAIIMFALGIFFVTTPVSVFDRPLTPWQLPARLTLLLIIPLPFLVAAFELIGPLPSSPTLETLASTILAALPLLLIPLLLHLRTLIDLIPQPTFPWSYRPAAIALALAFFSVAFRNHIVPILPRNAQQTFAVLFGCFGTLGIVFAYLFPACCLVVAMIDLRRAALYAPVAAKYLAATFKD